MIFCKFRNKALIAEPDSAVSAFEASSATLLKVCLDFIISGG